MFVHIYNTYIYTLYITTTKTRHLQTVNSTNLTYRVVEKVGRQVSEITSSNFDRFSKYFHRLWYKVTSKEHAMEYAILAFNKYDSNACSRCGPGNAHFISIRQVSLLVSFPFFIYLLINYDLSYKSDTVQISRILPAICGRSLTTIDCEMKRKF